MRRAFFVVLVLLLAIGCGSAPPPTTTTTTPAPDYPVQLDAELGKRIDAVLDKAIAEQRAVGVVMLVARDGKVVYRRAVGFADREAKTPVRDDTLFRLASMTKPIVSAAAMALVEQGKLSLEDPVTKWLPEFRPKLADGREPVITVRHLITHTSGLSYKFLEKPDGPYHGANVSDGLGEPGLAMAENLRRLASAPLVFEPGAKWNYGLSIDVLGAVVEKAGGAPLPEIVAATVTRPLGMIDTVFTTSDRSRVAWPYGLVDNHAVRMTEPFDLSMMGMTMRYSPARLFDAASFPSGGAGMAATAGDYLRFAEALRRGGGAPFLRPETVRAMTTNQIGELAMEFGPGMKFGFGFGVLVDRVAAKSPQGNGTIGWGGAYGTDFWVDPEARLSVVVMGNVAGDMGTGAELHTAVYGK